MARRKNTEKSDETGSFFSQENLHRFFWAILVAFAVALCRYAYNEIRGKDKVVVATPKDGAEPIVVRVENPQNSPPPPPQLESQLRDLIQELKRLRANTDLGRSLVSGTEPLDAGFNFVQVPEFKLPENVKGYTHRSISGIADVSCPPEEINSNEAVTMEMRFLAAKRHADFSPIFIRILRYGAKPNTVILEHKQQYELRKGLNRLRIQAKLPSGEHELRLGLYTLTELDGEYPPLYSVRCSLKVAGSNPASHKSEE